MECRLFGSGAYNEDFSRSTPIDNRHNTGKYA